MPNPRTLRTLLTTFILGIVSLFIMAGDEGLPTPVPEALVPVSDDPNGEMLSDPIVGAANGGTRFQGQVMAVVTDDFHTGTLRDVFADVELIREGAPNVDGTRQLLIRVPDAQDAAYPP